MVPLTAAVPDVATESTADTVVVCPEEAGFEPGPEPVADGESLQFEQETKAPAKSADAAKRPKILREIFFTISLRKC